MAAVAQISFFSDPAGRLPQQLLQDWPTLPMLAEAAALGGARVAVIQASEHIEQFCRDGVDYHFLPFDREPARLRALLEQLQPEVLHMQGLGFAREVLGLAAMAPGLPIVLQDRADRPSRRPWKWLQQRRAMSVARGLMFCAREQAAPFRRRGLIPTGLPIYELPGSSCSFQPRDQTEARRATGLAGNPCLLWVAHLDRNKDPLTVLEAVARAAEKLPGLQLWCCFGQTPLLMEVQARIAADPRLTGRVHLLGAQPYERIEQLMSAADFFVQGSHHESTGYSLLEALACGLPPLVTDIPSFRTLVGEEGALWRVGDAAQLARLLVELSTESPAVAARRRAATRQRFEACWSPAALGRRLCAVYQDLLSTS